MTVAGRVRSGLVGQGAIGSAGAGSAAEIVDVCVTGLRGVGGWNDGD